MSTKPNKAVLANLGSINLQNFPVGPNHGGASLDSIYMLYFILRTLRFFLYPPLEWVQNQGMERRDQEKAEVAL